MPRRKRQQEKEENGDDGLASTEEDEEVVQEAPTSASLYQILGVDRSATHDDIRKAYHKLALRLHPDKNPGDQSAKEKFQSLQNVIAILGDPAKRKVYDQTGSVEDAELSSENLQNLYNFFRTQYKKVTEEDIEEFANSFRGSENEKQDLKELYSKWKGNMDRVFDCLMCSIPQQDSHRFMDTINKAIEAGELVKYDVYKKWAAKVAKKPRPSSPLKPAKKTRNDDGPNGALVALIVGREKQRMDSFAAALEAKYAGKSKSKKGGKFEEPSEEEFEAARQRVNETKGKKRK